MDQGEKQKKPRTRRGSKAGKQRREAERKRNTASTTGNAGQSQGPSGSRPAVKIITVPITSGPKKAPSQGKLEDLAFLAAKTSLPLEQRIAPLHQLEKILSTSSGQKRASRFFDGIAPPLLQLLCDSDSVISAAAVAALTAWLTTPGDTTTTAAGLCTSFSG